MARNAVTLLVQLSDDPTGTPTRVRVMHPLHCLQSKLENKQTLRRSGATSEAQLEATVPILREYVSDALGVGTKAAAKLATTTLDKLGEYLERHGTGRQADRLMRRDPLAVLEHFLHDARIPEPFRSNNIANSIERIRAMRRRRVGRAAKGPTPRQEPVEQDRPRIAAADRRSGSSSDNGPRNGLRRG